MPSTRYITVHADKVFGGDGKAHPHVEKVLQECIVCGGTHTDGESKGIPIACGNCMLALTRRGARIPEWAAAELGLLDYEMGPKNEADL